MRFFYGLAALFLFIEYAAAGIPVTRIPEPLQPWIDWVLHGLEDRRCPVLYNQVAQHRCAWPSTLVLDIGARGGTFEQHWTLNAEGWVSLPGDRRHWPQDVRIDGVPALVMERDGRPIIKARPGERRLSGRFSWDGIPESLQIPKETALLTLTVQAEHVANPPIEDDGRIWLRKRAAPAQEDQLEFQVFRHILDEVPLVLTTRLNLKVSGQAREVTLGRALPKHFIPLSLQSSLPARLEPDGRLRVQIKPGNWLIELRGRHPTPVDAITLPQPDGPWAEEEVWSFQAVTALRMVTVEGVPSLDPAQTNLPDEWRRLPTYLMTPGDTLRLLTRKRGDADPAPDRLNLEKTLWLDFDGGGYTVQDQLNGTISRSARLEATPETQLGRVAVNGQDQFITRLQGSTADGIEVRQGTIQLTADSRLETGDIGDLPAVGWQVSPLHSRAILNLPPGWRLLNVSGVDSASNTWLFRWNLLDIFIVLIIALGFARLWSWPYGVLALTGMILVYHEPNAPRLSWLALLAAIALLRVLPPGKLRTLTSWYRRLALFTLLVLSLVFTVQQVRGGLYPQLATQPLMPPISFGGVAPSDAPPPAAVQEEVSAVRKRQVQAPAPTQTRLKRQYTPDIKMQTGPGLPSWRWRQAVLSWDGPVTPEQRLGLSLLPPWATRLLLFIGVALILAMFMRMLERGKLPLPRSNTAAVLLLLLAFIPDARADIPSPDLLQELRARLTEAPDCEPVCATLASLRLHVVDRELRMRLQLHSQVVTAVPLAWPAKRLMPGRVSMEQEPLPVYRDSKDLIWVKLPAGRHTLEIRAELPRELTTLQIPLPMTPGRVELEIEGWRAEGVYQGVAEGQIQLIRQRQAADAPLQPGIMPAFVQVERELILGIDWQVQTRVRRLSQADSAAVVEIPLLMGEGVTTPGIRVRDDRISLNLLPNQLEIQWSSTLEKSERIELQAGDTTDYVEIWRLRAEPLWHLDIEGIPVIHRHDQSGQWLPEWRPWPGESLTLNVSRPQGVEGKTVTIDNARLRVNPGQRATETTLELVIRSSRGSEHTLTLPSGAELMGVVINGESQPIKQSDQRVVLPLVPGAQKVKLAWRVERVVSTHYVTPAVDLGIDSVNSHVILAMPQSRWTLFIGGPTLGPAVLFWGMLIVIAVGALALGRFGGTLLRTWQWFLLGVGLSQAHVFTILLVAGWLVLLGRRKNLGEGVSNLAFNSLQVLLVLLTLASLAALLGAIEQGLLGMPAMQIAGNGSSAYQLQWYQDRSFGLLPQAWVVSVPLLVYRGLMLAWALWLAFALLKWLGWAWGCFSSEGIWRRLKLKKA